MPGLLKPAREQDHRDPSMPSVPVTGGEQPDGMPGAQQPMPQEDPMMGQPPMGAEGDMIDADADPQFQQALEYAKTVLYGEGADEHISKAITKSQSPIDEMANIAYELTGIVDEQTEGSVPDELFFSLMDAMVEEVAEIASASGVQLQPSDIASVVKTVRLRFLEEQGADTQQLHEAMNQISPDEINQLVGAA